MRVLLGKCEDYAAAQNLIYNVEKSVAVVFGEPNCMGLPLGNGKALQYTNSFRGKSIAAKGKLIDRVRNLLFQSGERKRKSENNAETLEIETKKRIDSDCDTAEIKEDVEWLKHHQDPWDEVLCRWKSTAQYRHQKDYTNVGDFIADWNVLNCPRSVELIDADFSFLYPDKRDNFTKNWQPFCKKLFELKKCEIKSDDYKEDLFMSLSRLDSDDEKIPTELTLMAHLVPPKGRSSKKKKFSVRECLDSIVVIVDNPGDINKTVEERKEEARRQRESVQPYLILLGSIQNCQQFYLVIDEIKYTFNSALIAFDTLFKSYQASTNQTPGTSNTEGTTTATKSVVINIADDAIRVLGGALKITPGEENFPVAKLRPEEDINQLAARVQPLLISYSNTAAKVFSTHCNNILARSPATGSPTREALELYRLLNFTALTMLRATTKTPAQMITGFLKRQYKTNIAAFTSPTLGEKFIPPCEACMRKVCIHVTKTRPPISSMFAKLVIMSTSDDRDLKAYLDAAVLTHTSWNGLGILQMIFDICQFFGKSWVELYNMSLISSTAHSWKAIIAFLKKYQSLTKPDMTVPWARVIDDAYFMKMGPRDHPTLAALLYKSLEYSQGDEGGLDQAVWVQRHCKIVERCIASAEHILGVLNQENVVVAAGAKESQALAKILNEKATTTRIGSEPQPQHDTMYDDA
ncbi:hypothetical protein PYW07_006502 [Mythimna separata]|uniref:Uncharacterized protein n=1 Tax=Mythimna separata TaxID=271217 RepID=A0AAD7YUM3_MYTSE|nr:hypothetical protein PYW07_006502 [Mythimna separata]